MKYSQAVLVACVGSAALVSAIPTSVAADAALNARNVAHSAPRKSRSAKIGKGLGKAITYGGQFAQSASGGQAQYIERRDPSKPRKPAARKAVASVKRVGSTAVKAAGGGQAVAQNLGAVAGLVNNFSQNQNQRRDVDTSAPTADAADPAAHAPNAHAHAGKGGKGGKRSGKRGGKALRKSEWLNKSPEEKAQLKAERKTRKAARRARKQGHPGAATNPTDATSTPPADASISTRDVDDLEARGFISNLKSNYVQSKADRAQRKADKLAAKAAAGADPSLAQRDLLDNEILALRDLVDVLDSREFEDELEARGLRDGWRALKNTIKGKRPGFPPVDATADPSLVQRDFEDILESREFEEELEARGFLSGFRALKNGIKGKTPGVDTAVDATVSQRDLFEDDGLVLRDLDLDDLDARGFFSNLKSNYAQSKADRAQRKADKLAAKVAASADPSFVQRDLLDEGALAMRDLIDILESREFEDELEARGLRDGWHALKNTIKGKRPGVPLVDATADPSLVQRDFEDFLESREFDEELEARGFLSGFRALKNKIKGKPPGVDAAADATLSQRDFEEDLSARNFADAFRAIGDLFGGKKKKAPAPAEDHSLAQRDFEEIDTRAFEINELD